MVCDLATSTRVSEEARQAGTAAHLCGLCARAAEVNREGFLLVYVAVCCTCLLRALSAHLGLASTRYGEGRAECGACLGLAHGRPGDGERWAINTREAVLPCKQCRD